jgi:hypothetical protein
MQNKHDLSNGRCYGTSLTPVCKPKDGKKNEEEGQSMTDKAMPTAGPNEEGHQACQMPHAMSAIAQGAGNLRPLPPFLGRYLPCSCGRQAASLGENAAHSC